MKKIMFMLAAAAMAVGAQGATYQWRIAQLASGNNRVFEAGTSTAIGAQAIYLFNATDTSQASLLSLLTATDGSEAALRSVLSGNAVDSGTLTSAGGMTAYKTSASGQGTEVDDSVSLYFAVLSKDASAVYLSNTVVTPVPEGDAYAATQFGAQAASKNAVYAEDATYSASGAGWYVTQESSSSDVPEPTSGLLMLVGLGALALRRRR